MRGDPSLALRMTKKGEEQDDKRKKLYRVIKE